MFMLLLSERFPVVKVNLPYSAGNKATGKTNFGNDDLHVGVFPTCHKNLTTGSDAARCASYYFEY